MVRPVLLLHMVGDDGAFDSVVKIRGDYALFIEIGLGAIGAEADDAIGPDTRDAGDLHPKPLTEARLMSTSAEGGGAFDEVVGVARVFEAGLCAEPTRKTPSSPSPSFSRASPS